MQPEHANHRTSRHELLATSAVVLGGLLVAVAWPGWPRWLGFAAIMAAGPLPWRALVSSAWWRARRARLPVVLLLALFVVLLGPLLMGEPPASRDHAIHYFQLRLLVEELLPSGRLWGWSESLNHGYPFGESYPVLGYLWMAAAHLLSLGAISLRTSYAWGLAALWMFSAGVVWWLAGLVTRELASRREPDNVDAGDPDADDDPDASATTRGPEIARWAGLAAATLWLMDPGASRQGGWTYLMFHGVWPQLLAASLWAVSLGLTWQALGDPRPRRLALAALALGASLWAHPFGLITAACSAGAWALVILVGRHRFAGPGRTWAVIHGAAFLIGVGWLATFFGSAEAMARAPVRWAPLSRVVTQLLQGTLMLGHWAWAIPLALFGGVAVVRRGGTLGWVVLGLGLGHLVLASEEAITVMRLDLLHPGFKNLQFPRYALSLKPLLFALGGVGLGQLIALVRARAHTPLAPDTTPIGWARRGVVALLLAPLVASVAPEAGRLVSRPVGSVDTLARGEQAEAEAELLGALRREAQALPADTPLTVAVMRRGMGGGMYPVMSIADAGGRLVLDEHVATVNFKHHVHRRPEAYEGLGVTHVIHDREIPEREEALLASVVEIGRFGAFTLERFIPPRGTPRRVAELRGLGTLEVEVDEPERLVLHVGEVEAGTRLDIGRAPHLRWQVTHDGEVLPGEEIRLDSNGTAGLAVELPGPGRVELTYLRGDFERRAPSISGLMVLVCLAGLALGGHPLADKPLGPRLLRRTRLVALVLALAVIAFVVRRQAATLTKTWVELGAAAAYPDAEDERQPTFVRDLVIGDEIEAKPSSEAFCNALQSKDVLDGCSETAHRPALSFLYREPYLYRCLRFSVPPDGGETVLHFPALPSDEHVIVGAVTRHRRKGKGKELFWGSRFVNKQVRNRVHDFALDDESELVDGRPTITLRNDGRKVEQVCVTAALMQRE